MACTHHFICQEFINLRSLFIHGILKGMSRVFETLVEVEAAYIGHKPSLDNLTHFSHLAEPSIISIEVDRVF